MKKLSFSDENWAVFNSHVNDAGKRALKIIKRRCGDVGVKEIKDAEKKGVMTIFHTKPTYVTQMYGTLCYVFANGLDKP